MIVVSYYTRNDNLSLWKIMGDIRHLWTLTYHQYYIARAVFLLRFSVANRRMRLYFFSVLSTHHIISVSLSLLIMIIMWTVHFYLLMYELCLCPVWNNLHGVWAHCAAAKTSDGNKFKNATSARKDHIGVSILLQLECLRKYVFKNVPAFRIKN